MTRSMPRIRPAVYGLLAVLFLSPALRAQSEYRGRMFTGGGPNRPAVVNVKIVVDAMTTAEEVDRFQRLLAAGDIEGFYASFRQVKKGSLQFTGGLGLRIDFYAASELPTDKGTKILLAGESRDLETGVGKRAHGNYLFLIVELELDGKGSGQGRVFEDARIGFSAPANLTRESYITTPKEIVNIKKTK